eukprot:CAMPEP_0168364816 /NCGR_PEP_ID=MMETSP0228-20121227/4399_1 /TAXON_ID=133427 /ORGANISM="Protoceratium reticulatum, Strain CCCM 535 (=CCMP 1889)" /LENGTH=132 /DNA_ID=CAMNT_0008377581 /DNA_START=40 /DNA_END=438 /DNA_ORIENTATION=-
MVAAGPEGASAGSNPGGSARGSLAGLVLQQPQRLSGSTNRIRYVDELDTGFDCEPAAGPQPRTSPDEIPISQILEALPRLRRARVGRSMRAAWQQCCSDGPDGGTTSAGASFSKSFSTSEPTSQNPKILVSL